MSQGLRISVAAHGGLMLWVALGGAFGADPPQMQVADVTILTEAEFAALTAPASALEAPSSVRPAPEPDPEPEPEPAPAPVTPPPDVAADPGPAPLPPPDSEAPEVSDTPTPAPAPRVAPTPVAPPPPGAVPDDVVRQAAEAAADTAETAEAEAEATAPEAAATEIVTEAEEPARALARSTRPQARPVAVDEAPAPEPEPTPADPLQDALAAAVADAASDAPPASGPPLTQGEREGLRLAVQRCWVVDVGSQAASVTVTLGFDMARDGTVIANSLRLLDAEGGEGPAVQAAYEAARRALLRCQQGGYDLPADKFAQWQRIEMTFNPSEMRLR
jgi:hypothetical protein